MYTVWLNICGHLTITAVWACGTWPSHLYELVGLDHHTSMSLLDWTITPLWACWIWPSHLYDIDGHPISKPWAFILSWPPFVAMTTSTLLGRLSKTFLESKEHLWGQYWRWMRRTGSKSTFQFMLKVFDRVEGKVLCRTPNVYYIKPSLS